ncbi:phage antirepressor KilAC domain-containing protein [Myroides sp. NP-2]|uniref:phage antirepressor KilAC domain-containing protein n=1 Tax=Myroides sp. NP-2 TaxID=2759945 RepID=UPI0015F7BC36|nr:phage antirepressor KilAC domain-containing protein [Myroides sp. NP-2]MBB1150427.1 phage antirepressor KilAC domain-containing protein [Myroides sp. NP-2]
MEHIFQYNNQDVTFQLGSGDVMVNATQMAKPFGKTTKDYLRTQSSDELISALSARLKCLPTDLLIVKNGGTNPGTWMHEDIALDFAQWLSIDFKLWCNDRIKELLQKGVVTINNDDETIAQALNILQKRLDASKQQLQILEGQNTIQREEIKILSPKAEYTDKVLQSTSTLTVNQIALELGITSIKLNRILAERKIQYKQGGIWLLTAKYRDMGYAELRTFTSLNQETKEQKTYSNTVWTEKGRLFIHQLLKKPA